VATVKKAKTADEAIDLRQIPNIGVEMVKDFQLIGISEPSQLKGQDAYQLYVKLCDKTRKYHDPCVLDTFLSAVHFMNGKGAKSWWDFTEVRKKNFSKVEAAVKKWQTI
jgi:hypothetical protein